MVNYKERPRVIMLGAGRSVKGGVTTVVNSYFDNGLADKVDLMYIETMRDGSKIKKLFIGAFAYIRFCALINKYDIIHVHMATDPSFTRKSLFIEKAFKRGKKIIIHEHGGDFENFYYNLSGDKKRKRICRIFEMADKVVVLTDAWKDFFAKNICAEDKIVVINNGILIPKRVRQNYSDKNILYLGRIEEQKGIFELLDAMRDIIRIDANIHLYLGGDGKDMDKAKNYCYENKLEENVHFLGWIANEKEQMLEKCSLFILPSHFEALPMSVLEAMGAASVVIATRVGGLSDLITDRENGYLIEPRDREEIKRVVLSHIYNIEEKHRVGKSARNLISEKYNITDKITALVELYCSLWNEMSD